MPDPLPTTTVRIAELVRNELLRYRQRGYDLSGPADEYADVMRDAGGWGPFPPLAVVRLTGPHEWTDEETVPGTYGKVRDRHDSYPAGSLVLVGGFTRSRAADLAGVVEAPAVVTDGTWADALAMAWRENADHGRPRTAADIRAVLDHIHAYPAHRAKTERQVAELAKCSKATVHRYRSEPGYEERYGPGNRRRPVSHLGSVNQSGRAGPESPDDEPAAEVQKTFGVGHVDPSVTGCIVPPEPVPDDPADADKPAPASRPAPAKRSTPPAGEQTLIHFTNPPTNQEPRTPESWPDLRGNIVVAVEPNDYLLSRCKITTPKLLADPNRAEEIAKLLRQRAGWLTRLAEQIGPCVEAERERAAKKAAG